MHVKLTFRALKTLVQIGLRLGRFERQQWKQNNQKSFQLVDRKTDNRTEELTSRGEHNNADALVEASGGMNGALPRDGAMRAQVPRGGARTQSRRGTG